MKNKISGLVKSIFGMKVRLWAVILACAITFGAGYGLYGRNINNSFGGRENFANAQKLLEVMHAVDSNFVGSVDSAALTEAASSAMVRSLDDRWSYYMSPADYEAYKLYASNQYAGIGVTIEPVENGFQINAVTSGSPAANAGLLSGDIITAVEEESVAGYTLTQVREIIRSYLNATVRLTIERDGDVATYTVDCTVIYNNPVSYSLLDNRIGYVRITNFEAGAGQAAADAVDALMTQGAIGIVFDVRDNPGGLLRELVTLLDYLLPEGDIFVSVNRAGAETVTRSDNICVELPMAVLINAETYSAAEFFAAAMDEYDWATLVGERTTGKARSQINVELSDGSAVHISSNQYLTPNRVDLAEQGGISPDYEVPMTGDGDAQLDAAISAVLRG